MRPFFLECCSTRVKPDKVIELEPTYRYVDRYVVYGHCIKCDKPIYKLFEFDLVNASVVINRDKPKRIKHVGDWIDKLEQQASNIPINSTIKHGNKSAMAFIFGKSKETPLGIVHTGFDFNGTKRKEFLSVK